MDTFKPVNADHAITAVAFVLEFDRPISQPSVDALVASPEAQSQLPWIENLPAVTMTQAWLIRSGAPPSVHPGPQFAFLRPDGQPMWSMRIAGQEIRVECFQYTRWDKVWTAAKGYITAGFEKIRSIDTGLRPKNLTLQVTDQFVGATSGYDLNLLIKKSDLIGQIPFSHGDLWHVHLGWFDQTAWGRTLNNLSIQSNGQPPPQGSEGVEEAPFKVTIMHLQQSFINEAPDDLSHIDMIMSALHSNNKNILLDLLSEDALSRIGLKKG